MTLTQQQKQNILHKLKMALCEKIGYDSEYMHKYEMMTPKELEREYLKEFSIKTDIKYFD